MSCDLWRGKIDAYVDGEIRADELPGLNAHLRECSSCTADLLSRVQLKLAVQTAGKRFAPSSRLRERVQESLPGKKNRTWAWNWIPKLAPIAALVIIGFLALHHWSAYQREQTFGELADLHVSTLASSTPVDVISTNRHTVKPWFQGKLPFTFNIPELEGTPFTLVGGRVTYLDQAPGAQLLFTVGSHRISVFIFQNRSSHPWTTSDGRSRQLTFTVESWSQDELHYFVIGDANADDIHKLCELLK
jgi:anti-sigma factor RsiW